jgi:hypothetical protein
MAQSTDYVRLSPIELVLRGYSRTSRRYVLSRERYDPLAETISENRYRTLQHGMTKGLRTKALRKGTAKYLTPRAAETERYKRRTRHIRLIIPEVTSSDLKLIDKKSQQGYNALTETEKKKFSDLFARYPRKEVLEALGSPPVK